MSASNRDVVLRFAQALDTEDYDVARALLDPQCVYVIRGEEHRGPDAIIASYKDAGDWANDTLDHIAYESAVRLEADPEFVIEFADLLRHGGVDHRHECEQKVRLNGDGKIVRIEHVDLPGEKDRLDAYFGAVGLDQTSD